jgi:hypothetical protein
LRTSEASVRQTLAEKFLYNLIKAPVDIRSKTKKLEWYADLLVELTSNYGCVIIDNLGDPPITYKYRELI